MRTVPNPPPPEPNAALLLTGLARPEAATRASGPVTRLNLVSDTAAGSEAAKQHDVSPSTRPSLIDRIHAVQDQDDDDALSRTTVYHSVIDSLADVVFQTDAQGRWTYLSPAWSVLTGLSVDESIGLPIMDLIHPGDADLCRQMLRTLFAGELTTAHEHIRVVTLHAGARWVVFRARADVGANGRVVGARGTMYDFTERKAERVRLEEQLRQAQRMESVGRLAGGISHDFNNLLTVIKSYAELIADAVPSEARVTADIGELRRAADRAVSLTRQLLAFSRQQILKPTELDISAVVADMGAMLRCVIGEDVVLRLNPSPETSLARADAGQLEQVIVNLAVNARDAMPGGGTLTVTVRPTMLDSETARRWGVPVTQAPYVLLEVSDTGQGMDAETQRRIFEPFFTTKEKGRGTGLGLATVYGIVKQSGGYIWVDSTVGVGTTFQIWLPRVGPSPQAAGLPTHGRRIFRGTGTVLVVEDEYSVRTLARRVLEDAGYTVLDAANADQAIFALRGHQQPIDLLLTDVVMPGVNGRELAQEVEVMCPNIKVLYMSGYDDGVLAERMRGSGGTLPPGISLLEKPFTPESLTRNVRDTLGGGEALVAA